MRVLTTTAARRVAIGVLTVLTAGSMAGCGASSKKLAGTTSVAPLGSSTASTATTTSTTAAVDTSSDTGSGADSGADSGGDSGVDTGSDTGTDTGTSAGSGGTATEPTPAWESTATGYRGRNGLKVTYKCPAAGTTYSVWGSGYYTDDSSVCTAAVHAGLITVAKGGTVTIEIAAGRSSYNSSTKHGIDTTSYGSWSGSYFFPAAPPS